MIQTTYHLRPEEIAYQNETNGQATVGFSSMLFLTHLAFMPPALASFLMGEIGGLAILAILYCAVMAMVITNYLRTRANPEQVIQVIFTPKARREIRDGSINEVLMADIENWSETNEFFEFERFGIITIEPKRAYTPEQQETLRSYFAVIGNSARPVPAEPCDLYTETHSEKILARWVFRNQRTDFDHYRKGGFRSISLDQPGEIFLPPSRRIFNIILMALLAMILLPYFVTQLLFETQWAIVWGFLVGWPILSTLVVFRIWKQRAYGSFDRIKDSLFDRDVEVGIQNAGWFLGNAASMTFHPWSNVNGFSLSRTLLLIVACDLGYMVPRRIFGDDVDFRKAIMFILQTHRDAIRQEEWPDSDADSLEDLEAEESGNPFQAPRY